MLARMLCHLSTLTILALTIGPATPHIAWAQPESPSVFHWRRAIAVGSVEGTALIAVTLDANFFQATRDRFPDVRLRNAQEQQVAYVIRPMMTTDTTYASRYWATTPQRVKVNEETGLQFELELQTEDPSPNGLRIVTPLRDFEHQAHLEASNDDENWTPVGQPTLLFDYSRYVDARNVELQFEPRSERRFRFTIGDVTAEQESQLLQLQNKFAEGIAVERVERTMVNRRPFRVDRVDFFQLIPQVGSRKPRVRLYELQNLQSSVDSQRQQTRIEFQTQGVPVTGITLSTPSSNFRRQVQVEAEIVAQDGSRNWRTLTTGTWSQFAIGPIAKQELTITIPETRSARYRLTVDNLDSPPLDIQDIQVEGPEYELLFLSAADQKWELIYGAEGVAAPRYDVAALNVAIGQNREPERMELGPPEVFDQSLAGTRPASSFWNDPKLLVTIIIVLTFLLGWGLYQAARRVDVPPSP